jgi:hypothetical protein
MWLGAASALTIFREDRSRALFFFMEIAKFYLAIAAEVVSFSDRYRQSSRVGVVTFLRK